MNKSERITNQEAKPREEQHRRILLQISLELHRLSVQGVDASANNYKYMEDCMGVVKQYEASKVALIDARKYTSEISPFEVFMLPVAKRIIEEVNYHRSVLPLQRIWRKRSAQNKSTASTEVVAGSPAELVTAEAPMSTKL